MYLVGGGVFVQSFRRFVPVCLIERGRGENPNLVFCGGLREGVFAWNGWLLEVGVNLLEGLRVLMSGFEGGRE